ncbi:unnamed protein product [Periconia digitata]|uniref:Uncharacterized protein n=1 Tax=Periconia digitata TaxID=1303443 RepID=A0A9W4UDT6_9PLEO|nr:unnamed protein product [Periconia digitata]
MQLPQPPKLAPPRSRPLVLNIAFSFFIALWICLQPYHLVHATEIPVPPEYAPHNEIDQTLPHAPPQAPLIDTNGPAIQERGLEEAGYAPEFTYFDRSLIGRQEAEVVKLENNKNKTGELAPKASSFFVFEKGTGARKREASVLTGPSSNPPGMKNTSGGSVSEDTLEGADLDHEDEFEGTSSQDSLGRRQAAGRNIWISANTCKQPGITAKISENGPPQLSLYVSSSEQKPGPDTPRERLIADPIQFEGGFANFTTQTDEDLFVGVAAPELVPGFEGSWSFEVAASLDGYYHNYLARDYLYMVDTDSDSAVFVTVNLSQSNNTDEFNKIKDNMPFTMYTFSTKNATQHWGLEHSYCGLQNLFNSANNISVNTTFTTKFGGGQPKAQFNVQGLETNAQYTGFLAVGGGDGDLQLPLWAPNNIDVESFSTVRQGGQVFAMWNWTTKAGKYLPTSLLIGLFFYQIHVASYHNTILY